MVAYADREETGSDVNVAAYLLVDVLTGTVDLRRAASRTSRIIRRVLTSIARTAVQLAVRDPAVDVPEMRFMSKKRPEPSDASAASETPWAPPRIVW